MHQKGLLYNVGGVLRSLQQIPVSRYIFFRTINFLPPYIPDLLLVIPSCNLGFRMQCGESNIYSSFLCICAWAVGAGEGTDFCTSLCSFVESVRLLDFLLFRITYSISFSGNMFLYIVSLFPVELGLKVL